MAQAAVPLRDPIIRPYRFYLPFVQLSLLAGSSLRYSLYGTQLRGYTTEGAEMDIFRKKLEGRLGYSVYDCVWNRAVRDYGVDDEPERLRELQEALEDLQEFAEEVDRELEIRPTTKPRRSMDGVRRLDESGPDLQSELLAESFYIDSDSRSALRALSAYAALKADEDPRVTGFRRRVLGQAYLSTEQATDLLYSHAARFLTLDQMRDLGVPLSGHETTLLEPYAEVDREGYFDHRVSLRIEPPGISLVLRYTNLIDDTANAEELARCVEGRDGAIAPYKISLPPVEVPGTEFERPSEDRGSRRITGPILLSGFDTANRPASIWPGSLVDEIYSLAQELSESFMWPSRQTRSRRGIWWNVDAVAVYLLSRTAPLMHPIKVKFVGADSSIDVPSHVVLDVFPWLRPESIVESYKAIRKALGVSLRNQGSCKFEVVTFVLQRSKSHDPELLNFKGLRESWDSAFPDKKFKDTYSFRTYFERGLQAVQQRYYL
jgi:hypothetical protein